MPRKGRKFTGSTWKKAFLYDAKHYGLDPLEPNEFTSDEIMARAWFRDAPNAASIVALDQEGVRAIHYTVMTPGSEGPWAAYHLMLSRDEFLDLVRKYMKVFPRPFQPNGRQLASLAYEMLVNYVAVGPGPRDVHWHKNRSELPRHVRLFLERSS